MKLTLERTFSILSESKLGIVSLHALVLTTAPGGIRMVDLSIQTKTSTANITGTVDRLERLGYAERYRDPQSEDRRVVRVRATEAGKELVDAFRDKMEQAQA
jgi:DNA-binding MarR family transcriptional regulator